MKEQMYRQDCETRELRAKVANFEAAERQVRGEWENTCEDLTKELKYVQGEMTQKELVFQKVEQELRYKLNQMGEAQHDEKCDLMRRIEDLQSEVHHLANTKGFHLKKLKYLIFDEADRLLSMDFEKQINLILT